MAQQLEPVNICSPKTVPANRSGRIVHPGHPESSNNCSITLTGLQNGDHIVLLGLHPRLCVFDARFGDTIVKVDAGEYINGHCTSVEWKKIVTITGSQLKLKVESGGSRRIDLHCYPSEWAQIKSHHDINYISIGLICCTRIVPLANITATYE